jgi:hypothetical protein
MSGLYFRNCQTVTEQKRKNPVPLILSSNGYFVSDSFDGLVQKSMGSSSASTMSSNAFPEAEVTRPSSARPQLLPPGADEERTQSQNDTREMKKGKASLKDYTPQSFYLKAPPGGSPRYVMDDDDELADQVSSIDQLFDEEFIHEQRALLRKFNDLKIAASIESQVTFNTMTSGSSLRLFNKPKADHVKKTTRRAIIYKQDSCITQVTTDSSVLSDDNDDDTKQCSTYVGANKTLDYHDVGTISHTISRYKQQDDSTSDHANSMVVPLDHHEQKRLEISPPNRRTSPRIIPSSSCSSSQDGTNQKSPFFDAAFIEEQHRIYAHIQQEASRLQQESEALAKEERYLLPDDIVRCTSDVEHDTHAPREASFTNATYKEPPDLLRQEHRLAFPLAHFADAAMNVQSSSSPRHVERMQEKTKAASKDRVEYLPGGRKVRIKGTHHIYKSIQNGNAVIWQCPSCQAVLQVDKHDELLYCVCCHQVSLAEVAVQSSHSEANSEHVAQSLQQQEYDVASRSKTEKFAKGA